MFNVEFPGLRWVFGWFLSNINMPSELQLHSVGSIANFKISWESKGPDPPNSTFIAGPNSRPY